MSLDRHVFAQAERLAYFARDTFHAPASTILQVLCGWRDTYDVGLSDGALALITAHVCVPEPVREPRAAELAHLCALRDRHPSPIKVSGR